MLRLLKRRSSGSAAGRSADHESMDTLSCRFDGTVAEYFEIWIVNVLLMVCSLGVFGPWAAARRRQYFYSKTSLGKYQLSYRSAPKKLVFWAAVRAVLVLAFMGTLVVQPVWALAVFAVAALLYPFYRHQALVEHAAAIQYRGHALSYTGTLKDSYLRLIVWPVLTVALGFFPLGHSLRSSWGYRFEHHNYGAQPFAAKLKLSKLWALVALTALTACVTAVVVGLITAASVLALAGEQGLISFLNGFVALEFGLAHLGFFTGLSLMSVWPLAVWKAGSEHALAAGVQLEAGVSFDTEISVTRLSFMYFVNACAILLSLGMATPWAAIRLAHYRASVTTLLCYTDIEEFVGDKGMGVLMFSHARANPVQHVSEVKSGVDAGLLDLLEAA